MTQASSLKPDRPAAVIPYVDVANNHTLLKYFQNIMFEFIYVDNFGIALYDADPGETGEKAVSLRRLFVSPLLSQYHISSEQIIDRENNKQVLDSYEIENLLKHYPRLFVLGDPGTGKSTLINFLMLTFSNSGDGRIKWVLGKRVPFALILRDLDLSQVENWGDLWRAFLSHNKKRLTQPLIQDSEIVEQVFKSGQALIMLDGLDEITQSEQRKKLAKAIRQGMKDYPKCLFLISSRIIGFNQAELFDLPIKPDEQDIDKNGEVLQAKTSEILPCFYLTPFNEQQMRLFINNWYQLYVPKNANYEQRIRDLIPVLLHNKGLGHLARIPVLLNMICFIHTRHGLLPDGRADLYYSIAKTYLIQMDQARGLFPKDNKPRFDFDNLMEWLAKIAYQMQEGRTRESGTIVIREQKVKELLTDDLMDCGFTEQQVKAECNDILHYLSRRSGLFIPCGKNTQNEEVYAFAHLSFLEYFAAYHLKILAPFISDDDWPTDLNQRTSDEWWHETLVLFFETLKSLNNKKLVIKCLDNLFPLEEIIKETEVTAQHVLLAEIIMDETTNIAISTRQQWIRSLFTIYENCDQQYRSEYRALLAFHLYTCKEQFVIESIGTEITELNLTGTPVYNLQALAKLTGLERLYLGNTPVADLTPLEGLTQLQVLYLNHTQILDISPLAKLTQLRILNLGYTHVNDLKPLANLKNLYSLVIETTDVETIAPLAGTGLKKLYIRSSKVRDRERYENLFEIHPVQ